ncbi:MAG TPA: hypothetical protein VGK58_11410 [Lacipirellulaceae bacterium]
MILTSIISLILIGLSGVLLDSHRRAWRAAQQDPTKSERERRFALAQYRRRMQASGIIGVLGAAIGIGPLVPREPWPLVIYLASLSGACGCIMLLAALDAWATRQYYARLRNEQLTAQIKLARELHAATKSADADK